MDAEVLEAEVHSVLDRLSNDEPVHVEEEWIEEAGEQFKAALRKQVKPREKDFRIRMSNIGKPLCQLQMEKAGATQTRKPYNFVVRMLIGDAAECITRLILKACDAPVTSDGDKVSLEVAGETIKGDSDIDLDGAVYDVKSCSPWAFDNKWQNGYDGLRDGDTFGYIGQMFGYADAQEKPAGGWFVVDKSNGFIKVVPVEATESEASMVRIDRENTVKALTEGWPFIRCFDAEPETYYKKPTGAMRLSKPCEFCDFKEACWPQAKKLPAPASKAKNPPMHWYVEHPDLEKS